LGFKGKSKGAFKWVNLYRYAAACDVYSFGLVVCEMLTNKVGLYTLNPVVDP
jgi:hypothetical protein